MLKILKNEHKDGFDVYLIKENEGSKRIGFITNSNLLVLLPKIKYKNKKPWHWHEKMNAWSVNAELLTYAIDNKIEKICFQNLTSGGWYMATPETIKEKGLYKKFEGIETQVFLHDDLWTKAKDEQEI